MKLKAFVLFPSSEYTFERTPLSNALATVATVKPSVTNVNKNNDQI